ncbi:MAG: holo-ACP synthase [Actinomycetes bacterium]|nr:holo-ACP synthase [Actinomycetes bacterium]
MVLGLGVDIVEIERMRNALSRRPRMKERLFSEAERWYCEHKAHPETHYALRFAAKEAVLKALGTGFAGCGFRDVEVTHDPKGRPQAVLTGGAAAAADRQGVVEMHLSLSYTHATAVASAVAITESARPKRDEATDPKEELAREFKELRSLLDDLESRVTGADEGALPVAGNDSEASAGGVSHVTARDAQPAHTEEVTDA